MAELADALDSGSSDVTVVQVQVLSRALRAFCAQHFAGREENSGRLNTVQDFVDEILMQAVGRYVTISNQQFF